jgi:transcriptional regulator with XRE-family HTH domain
MKAKHQYQKINIGKNLQKIRRTLGLTQEQVAESLELAPRYISDIERDKTKGSLDTLVKLCNLYHVSPSYVLKDYINTTDTRNINDIIVGFSHLEDNEKDIIRELIVYMNAKKKELAAKQEKEENQFSDVDPDQSKEKDKAENTEDSNQGNHNSNSDPDVTIERDLRSITLVEVKPKAKRKSNSSKKKNNKE